MMLYYLLGAVAVSMLVVAGLLWRVQRHLAVIPALAERFDGLTHSLSLLTDTTEACFRTVAVQIEAKPAPRKRTARPRIAAAPRGETGTAVGAGDMDGLGGDQALQRLLAREPRTAGQYNARA